MQTEYNPSMPYGLPTAEIIRKHLLANITKLSRDKVAADSVATFEYYRDSLKAQYIMGMVFKETYPQIAKDEPHFLNGILESETSYTLCEVVFAAWLSLTPQQIKDTAKYAKKTMEYLSIGLVSSYPVPILRAAAYYAGFRLCTRDDLIPNNVVEDITNHAVGIVANIFRDQEITKGRLMISSLLAQQRRQQRNNQLP